MSQPRPADASVGTGDRLLGNFRGWGGSVLVIALLHYATLMAVPLTIIWLGSDVALGPIVVGFGLEVVRSVVRRRLKRKVRSSSLRDAALLALDKNRPIPEADVDSAFWAAQLAERAVTVDVPALLAATGAGASILILGWSAVSGRALAWVFGLALSALALAVVSNRLRAVKLGAVVERRQRTAGWLAAAERDCGEIYGERARYPFVVRLDESVQAWSDAEDELERDHLRHRLLLAALFAVAVFVILKAEHIDPLHVQIAQALSARGVPGLLILGTAAPAAYVFALHADSLLTAYAGLKILELPSRRQETPLKSLPRRPTRLRAQKMAFAYPNSRLPALPACEFDIALNRIVLIMAPNGAGKTTLARLICGVLTPSSGSLEIDGITPEQAMRDDFGFVPQNPLIVETLSIEENVRLVAPEASAETIDRCLSDLGLRHPRRKLAGELSRGEQRRIAIARAIIKDPRLLVLDEPDVWLDEAGRALLAQILTRELDCRAVVIVSHRSDWLVGDLNVIDLSAT